MRNGEEVKLNGAKLNSPVAGKDAVLATEAVEAVAIGDVITPAVLATEAVEAVAIGDVITPAVLATEGSLVLTFSKAVKLAGSDLVVNGTTVTDVAVSENGLTVTISGITTESELAEITNVTSVVGLTDSTGNVVTVTQTAVN